MADFTIYNSAKLGKEIYLKKLRLMDIGAGCFAVNLGFSHYTCDKKRILRSVLSDLVLGFLRMLTIIWGFTDVSDLEYGTHVNYFHVLFCVGISLLLYKKLFFLKHEFMIALFLSTMHELQEN